MRQKLNQHPTTMHGPRPAYSPHQIIVASVMVAAILVAAMFAVSNPVAGVAVVVGVVVARRVVRLAHRVWQARRRTGRTRHVCIPMTDVCIEA